MALVQVNNEDTQIDFNDLEYLNFTDGWNGGTWSNWDVVNNPENYNIFLVSYSEIHRIKPFPKTIYGSDSDMGRSYAWKSKRLIIPLDTIVGVVNIDSLNIPVEFKLMYSKKGIDT